MLISYFLKLVYCKIFIINRAMYQKFFTFFFNSDSLISKQTLHFFKFLLQMECYLIQFFFYLYSAFNLHFFSLKQVQELQIIRVVIQVIIKYITNMKEKTNIKKQKQIKQKSLKNSGMLNKRSKSVIDIEKYKLEYMQTSASKQNINNHLKSQVRETFLRSQEKTSVSKKIQILIQQIKERQNKLNGFFKIYTILQNECGQQRCVQHNNNLSLYCQNQSKILCVHCMYGNSKHKTHKVYHLKDCYKSVCQDNKKLKQKITMNLRSLKVKENICGQNIKFLQNQFKFELEVVQKQFKESQKQLQKEQQTKLNLLKQLFIPLINFNTILADNIKKIQKQITDKIQHVVVEQDKKLNAETRQISKHMIFQKINQFSNNQGLCIQKANTKDVSHQLIKSRIKSSIKL